MVLSGGIWWRRLAMAGAISAALPAMAALVEFRPHERVALVGGSLAERQGLFGYFESLLHSRLADKEVVVRNFGWPADEVGRRQRPNDYTKIDDPLGVFGPETFLAFFGYNESFAGPLGLNQFQADYRRFIDAYTRQYGRVGRARFVLISPIAFENPNNPLLPEGTAENRNLRQYTEAIKAVAGALGVPFVDLFTPTEKLFAAQPGTQYTINGAHLNENGDREVALLLDAALHGSPTTVDLRSEVFSRLRAAVIDKSWVHSQDYRMLNGWYVYGGRRTWDTETFPLEYKKIRAMAAVRDRYVWDIAQERNVPPAPDDSQTGNLIVPKTRFGTPTQNYSEPKDLRYLGGDEALTKMQPAPGFEVSLFADETRFPKLAKPVQIAFDNRGRLWVACMPSYPQWRPGDPKPHDRLLIFEDKNGDGRADECKVFYDGLHCPTGFEFWNGGVLVISQPRLLFLKDTDGDDRADQVTHYVDGWGTDDTHHTMGAFEWSHGGLLHGLEGVSMSTALETPWGPFRNQNTPGAYVVDPFTWKIRHFITPGYGNPWCYVFNEWGQGITGDGTTAQQHWDTPLSGAQKGPRSGLNAIFNTEGMRPVIGSEFLLSRHFPAEVQGQFIYACVINMNGLTRFELRDDGAGYGGKRIPDLLSSTDRNFRPCDPQIGPDGALWFGDWHNPLIGHMQYSQRDPNRDHVRGRIYRLTAQGRPLLKPMTQFGRSIPELLAQLKEYEPRTRYRVRRELRDRNPAEVITAVKAWIKTLEPTDLKYDRYRLEALYVMLGARRIDRDFLTEVLAARTPELRAAAVHVLSDESERISDSFTLLKSMVEDPHPRVRLEAVRALSFYETSEAVLAALRAADPPPDYWLDYTLKHTLGALEPIWRGALKNGELPGALPVKPTGLAYLRAYARFQPDLGQLKRSLEKLIANDGLSEAERNKLILELRQGVGRVREGRFVFERVCTSCHKVQNFGINFGPDLTQIGRRLKKEEIIESILFPNAKVSPEWLMTNLTTKDGQELSGVVGTETETEVTIKLGGDVVQKVAKSNLAKRETLKVSNMPEGLAASLSAQEFLDLIEYLESLK